MARYKYIDISPRSLAVGLQRQLLPGTFEHAMNHLIDHELDLGNFDASFCKMKLGQPLNHSAKLTVSPPRQSNLLALSATEIMTNY